MTALLLLATAVLIGLNALLRHGRVRARPLAALAARDAQGRGRQGRALALEQVDEISDYISTVQFGITMASIGIGALGEPVIADALEPMLGGPFSHGVSVALSVMIAYLIITSAHIVAGELVPKLYAIDRAEGVARRLSRPLRFFRRLFTPFIVVLTGVATGSCVRSASTPTLSPRRAGRPRSSRRSSPRATPAASSTPARPGCSPASSTCTSRRPAR